MANKTEGSSEFPFTGKEALPETVDWRTKNIVTPVKNQVAALPVLLKIANMKVLYIANHLRWKSFTVAEVNCS